MPVARRYGPRQVSLTPLPGARLSAAETPLSAGAGLAQARAQKFGALAQLGGVAASVGAQVYDHVVSQERDRADQVALLDAQNQIDDWENKRLYDPNDGALAQKGKDALGLPEEVNGEYRDLTGKIAAGLSTDRQRQAFARVQAERGQTLDLTLRRHVFGEMQSYETNELRSTVENATNNAIANALDPGRISTELARAEQAITTSAPRLGAGPEQVQAQLDATRSQVHVGVIDRLLALEQTGRAQAYFDETKDQISGDKVAAVEQALEVGTLRKQAQTESDKIVAAGGTLTEQRDKARGIDDPKLRDEVMQRIEHEAAVTEAATRQAEEARTQNAFNLVDKTHDVTRIAASDWAQLSPSAKVGLREYQDRLTRGVPVETDLPTYYGLMRQAGDDPETFATRNLLELKGKLGEAEFKQLTSLQLSLRNRDQQSADKQLAEFSTQTQVLEDQMGAYGIDLKAAEKDPTSAVGQQVLQIRTLVRNRVNALQESTGKKATNADVEAIATDVLSKQSSKGGGLRSLAAAGAALVLPPDPFTQGLVQRFIAPSQKALTALTVDDLAGQRPVLEDALTKVGRPTSDPSVLSFGIEARARLGDDLSVKRILPAERSQLEAALRTKGQPVTDQTVLSLYLRLLAASR